MRSIRRGEFLARRLNRLARSNMSDNDLPGIRLETIVARIQQKMDPNSTVSHNEKLVDRLGNKRQYDVVIRGHYAGCPILGVIECKDHSRRKGPDAVEAFAKKTENLRANLKLMVSKKGFTPQALVVAEHEGIGCLSLLPEDPKQAGFSIGQMWYGVHRQWTDVRMEIQFPVIPAPIESFDLLKVKWDGKTVFNWFWRELLTTYKEYNEEGYVMIKNTFDQVRNIEIEGQEYPVEAITCIAHQVLKKKRRWISLTGDA